ncbi:CAP domain-containing protein [Streptomyces sp. NPDC047023]|uniref:CAP domain-containing protein n=1 Tax=Streptomyces sp. NPDC047023 TaxID=3155139 RepID=UPI0033CCC4F8
MNKHRKKTNAKITAVAFLGVLGVAGAAALCTYTGVLGSGGTEEKTVEVVAASASAAAATPLVGLSPPGTPPPTTARPSASASSSAPVPSSSQPPKASPTAPPPPGTPSPRPTPTKQPPSTAPGISGAAAEVVTLVNQERAKAGCGPLAVHTKLLTAARNHSQDMAEHGMSHTGSDGSTVGQRVSGAGYTWGSLGENVAAGQRTAEQAVSSWMKSEGHRASILNCSYTETGVAVVDHHWTQVFATRG